MTTITIDELETRLREVVDQIANGGEPVSITRDGVPDAEINPTHDVASEAETDQSAEWTDEQWDAYWDARDTLATEIGTAWPAGVSAVDATREDRSRLDDFLARNDDRGEER